MYICHFEAYLSNGVMDSSGALMTFLIQTLLNFKAADLSPLTVFPLQILSLSKHICLHRSSASPLSVFLEGPRAKGQCLGCRGGESRFQFTTDAWWKFSGRNGAEQNVSFPLSPNFFTRPTKSFVLKYNGVNAFILF